MSNKPSGNTDTSDIGIVEVYKRVPNNNPRGEGAFDEVGEPIAFEVHGGFFIATRHKTMKAAEKEKAERIAFRKKFPFDPNKPNEV